MAEIKLANGAEVKELRVFDGIRWVGKRGRVFINNKWISFIKPIPTFKDSNTSFTGLVRQANNGKIVGNKLLFDTLVRYSVK